MISFHNRVARAGHFAATLSRTARALHFDAEWVWADHLSGAHGPARRRDVLQRLRGVEDRMLVVANAKVLAEGIDIPAVDAVLFADPRGSTVDAIQAIGRALRRGDQPGKTATIIVPVLAGPGQDAELAGSRSAYRGVWEILRALRAHDQRAAIDLDTLYDGYRHRLAGQSEPALPGWLTASGVALPARFVEALTVATVDLDGAVFQAQWRRYLAAAASYHDLHGHLRIPQRFTSPEGLAVGAWISTQRANRRRLAPHRLAALDALALIHRSSSPLASLTVDDLGWEYGHVELAGLVPVFSGTMGGF